MAAERAKPTLYLVLAAVLLLAGAAFWLPRWWENREYRRAEAIAGVGAKILSGKLGDARGKIDPGMQASKVTAALGQPSFAVKTEGTSTHEIWTYYFSDGTLTVNLTDGYVARASTAFGPPSIRESKRPRRAPE
jgi:4-amino-4-deoxy-L-arabinose transferase-like glycosyltransferase